LHDPKLHLFVDSGEIQDIWRFQRVLNLAERYQAEPVLVADRPWEGLGVIRPTVMRDEASGRFRMWYQTYNRQFSDPYRWMVCYAESSDGVRWEKPDLGLVDCEGSRQNNIVYCPREFAPLHFFDNPVVVYDPRDPDPARRYKMTAYISRQKHGPSSGIYCLASPDGLRWQSQPEPLLPGLGDRHRVYWDERSLAWVLTTRPNKRAQGLPPEFGAHREVTRTESADFREWSSPRMIMKKDDEDPPDVQFYSMLPFHYGNQYLGLLETYSVASELQRMELCSSWDGLHWQRVCRRQPILANGGAGEWDDTRLAAGETPPMRVGDELWLWYDGWRVGHGPTVRPCAIGLARLRLDSFAGLGAGRELGLVISEPAEIAGPKLLVNLTAHGGECWVSLLDETGTEVPGYGKADCEVINGDALATEVRWRGGDLAPFVGKRLRLGFWGHHVRLWAYRFP
jgi:hypothetical protein